MKWIIDASDERCQRESEVGGKAATLARLDSAGFNVPAFSVIGTEAYRALSKSDFPTDFVTEVEAAITRLGRDSRLAVRSSAIGEDSAGNSFAGLYHTSLNVQGVRAVLDAIRACWASYENTAAGRYREERQIDGVGGAMAVVLQRMINSDWAGVCFTANPVRRALSEGIINVVEGLGESLVSGERNPEEITISANNGEIQSRRGDVSIQVPIDLVQEVWRVSKEMESELNFPQDTEWACSEGKVFVLQSRPITTLEDIYYSRHIEPWRDSADADPDKEGRLWSRMLADETWVSPISPIFYNIHNSTPGRVQFIRSHGDRSILPSDMFKYHRAIAYVDISVLFKMYSFQPKFARIRAVQNFVPAEFQQEFRDMPFRWLGRLRRMLSYEVVQRRQRSFFQTHKRVVNQWPDYVRKTDEWLDLELSDLSLDQLRQHEARVKAEMAKVGPPCAIAVLSHASDLHLLLTGLLERWCSRSSESGESLYAKISAGLEGSETLRQNDTLWELGKRLRELEAISQKDIGRMNWTHFEKTATEEAEGKALVEDFVAFWRKHRHLGSSYKDLIWPRWGDDIELCFDVVKGYAGSRAVRPSDVHRRTVAQRKASQAEILTTVKGVLGPIRRRILKFLMGYNELYMAIRDNHRYYIDRHWYLLRKIYLSYGDRLVESGVLSSRDEVMYLGVREIEDAVAGLLPADEAEKRIGARRDIWQHTLREQGPKFLNAWDPVEGVSSGLESDPKTTLAGIGASPGQIGGVARIVFDVSGLREVRDGDILVTRQTDPSWTPVFGRIAGLVLETGGVLSHGTSLCREYDLPCVTAVERATSRIPDGSYIELDGTTGAVRIAEGGTPS